MSALLLAVTTACLVIGAVLLVSALRIRGLVAFVLAVYLLTHVGVVLLLAALSPPQLVLRWAVVVAVVVLFALSIVAWGLAGRPMLPSGRRGLRDVKTALYDPIVGLLSAAVGLGFIYLAALAFFTPPNSWDAMWIHLARAAFWKQEHAVGFIAHANVPTLNTYPPVASMDALYAMVVAGDDRFVTAVALAAYVATQIGVFGVALRLYHDVRVAMFGALVFATLPVVALQASGALNDLVVASFLIACVYFALGERRLDAGLAGVAFALAVGAKLTAVLALPVLISVVAIARPKRLREIVLAELIGGVLGSAWYILNLVERGSVEPRLAQYGGQGKEHGFEVVVARTLRLLVDFAEVPGAGGWWAAVYVVAAGAAAAFAFAEARRFRSRALCAATCAAVVALLPLVILVAAPPLKRAYQWVFFHAGRPDLGVLDQDRGYVGASALASFYGPLGPLLVLSVAVVVILAARRRLPVLAAAFAAAPLIFLLTIAITLVYSPYWGRLFVFPVALAVAGASVLARVRPLAWGIAAVAAVTLALTLRANDEKPLSVWGEPRWQVQSQVGGRHNGELAVIRFFAQSVPLRAHVGLAIREVDWSYPFFGREFTRTIRFVPSTRSVDSDLEWLVVAPLRGAPGSSWRRIFAASEGWSVFVRRR